MMEKILTIIIPTYNMEKYLDKCLTSLIIDDKELMRQLEVLVINDGSKDRSSEIAHNYESNYPDTFRVIDKENGNYGSCINRGLKEATGKYVKVLDADDSFDTKEFAELLKYMSSIDVDMVISDYCKVDIKGHVLHIRHYNLTDNKKVIPFDLRISDLFYKKNLQMHAIAYRTENLRRINYRQTEGISYTDQEWTYTPLITVKIIGYFHGVVYCYLFGREGQTMDPAVFKRTMLHNEICVLKKLEDFVTLEYDNDSARRFLTKWAYVSLNTIYYNYLIRYCDLPRKSICDFDKKLVSIDVRLFLMTDELTLDGTYYKYVKLWRKNKYKLNGFVFHFMVLYSRVYGKIRRMINE